MKLKQAVKLLKQGAEVQIKPSSHKNLIPEVGVTWVISRTEFEKDTLWALVEYKETDKITHSLWVTHREVTFLGQKYKPTEPEPVSAPTQYPTIPRRRVSSTAMTVLALAASMDFDKMNQK